MVCEGRLEPEPRNGVTHRGDGGWITVAEAAATQGLSVEQFERHVHNRVARSPGAAGTGRPT